MKKLLVAITLKGSQPPTLTDEDLENLAYVLQQETYDYLMCAKEDEDTDVDVTVEET